MNILITGANGFIGRSLCKRMLADGYQLRGAESENIKYKIIRQQQGEAAWGTRAGHESIDSNIIGKVL
ncbi:MAG: NAD-dependent epimerase/dehydratase family protein [Desulfobacterales bacterium]